MKDFINKLIIEGSRLFWTVVEATAGVVAGANVPLPDLGAYTTPVRGAVVVGVAALATYLKELARAHLK